MRIHKEFNNGLGILPVSVFVQLISKNINIDDIYNEISKHQCDDIIFFGNIIENETTLKWVCSRLISEGTFISLVLNHNILVNIPSNKVICFLNYNSYTKEERRNTKLNHYTENDMLILYGEFNIDNLNRILKILKNIEFKGKVYIKYKDYYETKEILNSGIDYIYLYMGICF